MAVSSQLVWLWLTDKPSQNNRPVIKRSWRVFFLVLCTFGLQLPVAILFHAHCVFYVTWFCREFDIAALVLCSVLFMIGSHDLWWKQKRLIDLSSVMPSSQEWNCACCLPTAWPPLSVLFSGLLYVATSDSTARLATKHKSKHRSDPVFIVRRSCSASCLEEIDVCHPPESVRLSSQTCKPLTFFYLGCCEAEPPEL